VLQLYCSCSSSSGISRRACCSSAAPVPEAAAAYQEEHAIAVPAAAAYQFVENCIASALIRCSTGVAIEESLCTDKVETSEVL